MAEEADRVGDVATAMQLLDLIEVRQLSLDEMKELVYRSDPVELSFGSTTLLRGWLMGSTPLALVPAVVGVVIGDANAGGTGTSSR